MTSLTTEAIVVGGGRRPDRAIALASAGVETALVAKAPSVRITAPPRCSQVRLRRSTRSTSGRAARERPRRCGC
jgi:hypothetical protein